MASTQEIQLLTKLLDLYKKRYTGVELEDKFNSSVEDLIESGDVQRTTYVKFAIENNIPPTIPKKKSSNDGGWTKPSSYNDSGCGGGRTTYRSSGC